MAQLFDDGSRVISRRVEHGGDSYVEDFAASFADNFEIDRTVDQVVAGGFCSVALQFPDELLPAAPKIISALQKGAGDSVRFFVLGDTSYGTEYVDIVNAQHLHADFLVHYGRACVSPPCRLPVAYVFGRAHLDVDDCAQQFCSKFLDPTGAGAGADEVQQLRGVLITYDVRYHYIVPALNAALKQAGTAIDIIVAEMETFLPASDTVDDSKMPCESCECAAATPAQEDLGSQEAVVNTYADATTGSIVVGGQRLRLPTLTSAAADGDGEVGAEGYRLANLAQSLKDYVVFYLGKEGAQLTDILMRLNQCECYSYQSSNNGTANQADGAEVKGKGCLRREGLLVNKMLMRRYYLVQRAKEGVCFGLVVGTLSVGPYLQILSRLRASIAAAGRKSYTIVIGKINPHKLANYGHVDVFVLVAGAESSVLQSREFHAPIVTPYELFMALSDHAWAGEYCTQFDDVLTAADHMDLPKKTEKTPTGAGGEGAGGEEAEEEGTDDDDGSTPQFSFVTGGYVQRPKYNAASDVGMGEGAGAAGKMVLRNENSTVSTIVVGAAATFLASRSFQGLESKIGESEVHAAKLGRSGIARGYAQEPGEDHGHGHGHAGHAGHETASGGADADADAGARAVEGKISASASASASARVVKVVAADAGEDVGEHEVVEEEHDEDEEVGDRMDDFIDAFDTTDEEGD